MKNDKKEKFEDLAISLELQRVTHDAGFEATVHDQLKGFPFFLQCEKMIDPIQFEFSVDDDLFLN